MLTSIAARIPNALLLVLDPDVGEVPTKLSESMITATDSAVAIGVTHESEGETRVALGRATETPDDSSLDLAWRGRITTGGRLAVTTVDWRVLAEVGVPEHVDVEIWTNDPRVPSSVWIQLV